MAAGQPTPPALDIGWNALLTPSYQPASPAASSCFLPALLLVHPSLAQCAIALTISTLFMSSDRC